MNNTEKSEMVSAYRRGFAADIVQARQDVGGEWGPIFATPPCSPDAMGQAARQFTRSRAVAVRHCRRARLRGPSSCTDVIVVTELPSRQQDVARIEDGVMLQVRTYLVDESLAALAAGFVPSDH